MAPANELAFLEFLQAFAARMATHPAAKEATLTEALRNQQDMSRRLRLDAAVYFNEWDAKKTIDPEPPGFDAEVEQEERVRLVRLAVEQHRRWYGSHGRRDE